MSGPMDKARAAWGDPPDWVIALAEACAASSQNRVAARLGRSAALVSNVLAARYTGDMAAVEERVRGVLMAATVECPALGTIGADACQDWRARSRQFVPSNMQRVTMFRACKRCPRNRAARPEGESQ